jgi:protein-L-isoaspartate(D-aspartate) O-methyltransferase
MTVAQINMVKQQVRCWDVFDAKVLDVLKSVPRERFVPQRYGALAYADANVPLETDDETGTRFHMMRPNVEGRLLQALEISERDTVFEVGTGSGYLTACLAQLARSVMSVDISQQRLDSAGEALASLGIRNCELLKQDVFERVEPDEFDAIAVTASLPEYDTRFEKWLRLGGRAFMVVGRPPIMEALLIRRTGVAEWSRESLFDTVLEPLVHHAARPAEFAF